MIKYIKGFFKWLKINYRDLREWLLDWIRFYRFIVYYFLIYIIIFFFCSLDYRVVAFIFLSFIILTITLFLIYIFTGIKNEDEDKKKTLNSATANLDEFSNYLKKFDDKNIDNIKNKNNDNLDDSEIVNSGNNLDIGDWEIEIDVMGENNEYVDYKTKNSRNKNNEGQVNNKDRYSDLNEYLQLKNSEILLNKKKNLSKNNSKTSNSSISKTKNKDNNFKV